MRMENRNKSREGFSLIEVIIAVAILAILSMPILLYFTNSAVHTANGKHEQSADMAAQSVVEEIDAMKSLEALEQALKYDSELRSAEGWVSAASMSFAKKVSSFVDTDSHDDRVTTLYRPVTVNAQDYMAKITIDYDAYFASGGGAYATGGGGFISGTTAKYNRYDVPQLQEMHSEGSAVFADKVNFASGSSIGGPEEKSAFVENGVRSLFYSAFASGGGSSFTSGGIGVIRNGCERSFQIDIVENEWDMSGEPTKYMVRGSYIMQYGSEPPAKVVLGVTQVAADKLKNIYMPFYPMTNEPRTSAQMAEGIKAIINIPTKLNIAMNTGDEDSVRKIGFSFIWQKGGVTLPSNYKIKPEVNVVDTSGVSSPAAIPAGMRFFCNSPLIVNGTSGNILYSEKEKRIAFIKVEIFDKNGYEDPDAKVLATSTTVKGM